MICPNCDIQTRRLEEEHGWRCDTCGFLTFDNHELITELAAIVSVDKNTGMEGLVAFDVCGTKMVAVNSNYAFLKEKVYPVVKQQLDKTIQVKIKRFKLFSEEE